CKVWMAEDSDCIRCRCAAAHRPRSLGQRTHLPSVLCRPPSDRSRLVADPLSVEDGRGTRSRRGRAGRMKRVSIAGVLGFVLAGALGFAALRAASGDWAAVMVTLTLLALLASIVGAVRGRGRSAWLGFAVFGWGYFAFGLSPWFRDEIRPHLLTSIA